MINTACLSLVLQWVPSNIAKYARNGAGTRACNFKPIQTILSRMTDQDSTCCGGFKDEAAVTLPLFCPLCACTTLASSRVGSAQISRTNANVVGSRATDFEDMVQSNAAKETTRKAKDEVCLLSLFLCSIYFCSCTSFALFLFHYLFLSLSFFVPLFLFLSLDIFILI
jgi:hypothetical protein